MSKRGIVAAFVIGSMLSAPTAFAAAEVLSHVTFQANGKVVTKSTDVIFKGKAYLPVDGVLATLKAAGVQASWKGNTLSVGKAASTAPKPNKTPSTATVHITDADYAALRDGHSFTGKTVTFAGRVFDTPQVKDGHVTIPVDITADQTGDIVDVIAPTTVHVQTGEFVTVTGRVSNQLADLIYPQVMATSVSQTTWGQAFYPSIHTFSPNLTQTQNGLTISVTSVEIAKGQVRIHLRADNKSGANVMIDDSVEDTLTQGSVQFKQQSTFDLGYPDFPDHMADGTTGDAVVIFNGNVANSGTLVFTVPVASDNYNQDWSNFVFQIQVPSH